VRFKYYDYFVGFNSEKIAVISSLHIYAYLRWLRHSLYD